MWFPGGLYGSKNINLPMVLSILILTQIKLKSVFINREMYVILESYNYLKNAINVKTDKKLKQMAPTPCKINHIGILGFTGHKSTFCAPKFTKIIHKIFLAKLIFY